MGTQTDTLQQLSEHGSQKIRVLMTIAAGADGTAAHTFTRAFKAAPKPCGIVRTVGGTAQEAVTPMISALSATAFTLAVKGTHAADASYYCEFEGQYV